MGRPGAAGRGEAPAGREAERSAGVRSFRRKSLLGWRCETAALLGAGCPAAASSTLCTCLRCPAAVGTWGRLLLAADA